MASMDHKEWMEEIHKTVLHGEEMNHLIMNYLVMGKH